MKFNPFFICLLLHPIQNTNECLPTDLFTNSIYFNHWKHYDFEQMQRLVTIKLIKEIHVTLWHRDIIKVKYNSLLKLIFRLKISW